MSSSPPRDIDDSDTSSRSVNKVKISILAAPNIRAPYIIERNQFLRKALREFCKRYNQPMKSLNFFYHDTLIKPSDTPNTLEMTDGDVINCDGVSLSG